MENLTYKELKEAIEDTTALYKTITIYQEDKHKMLILEAAKAYLPILLRQEFVKPNEVTTDEYLGKNFK